MQISSFLKEVETRAGLRDLLSAMLLGAALIGFIFLLYAGVDHLFSLSGKSRLVITACLALGTLGALAFDLSRKNRRRGLMWSATLVEQRTGTLNNQLITIAECEINRRELPAYLRARIEDDIARRLSPITAARVISLGPGRRASLLFLAAVATCSLAVFLWPDTLGGEFSRLILLNQSDNPTVARKEAGSPPLPADDIIELRVTLTPPAYLRRGPALQVGDGNIVALAGTRADVHIGTRLEPSAALVSVGGASPTEMMKEGKRSYSASFIVEQDSNYEISLAWPDGENRKWEEVYGIRAVRDLPPEAHITAPASDLLFDPEDRPASVSIAVAAKDDYGVSLMKLKYVKATGEGDAAKFQSGEMVIDRMPEDAEGLVRGAARLDLAALGVGAGDSVVFHAEVFDRNNVSGPGVGYSENIVVQVKGREQPKISLDDLRPDEALRYLTSQRMILIKTEKLHRLRGRLAGEEFLSRSRQIATEQKRFKESFNRFTEIESSGERAEDSGAQGGSDGPARPDAGERLKGGDVPEIPAGGSDALREMVSAIRAMWEAEGALGSAETVRAIEYENEALVHLKAAQRGLRYSSRFAARGKPVDLKRRYLGELEGIRSQIERVPRAQESAFDQGLRGALAVVYDAARMLARTSKGQASADQSGGQGVQDIERVARDLLSIKGEFAGTLLEPASKLKLVGRMLRTSVSIEEQQKAFSLTVQVASELSALLGRAERTIPVPPPDNLTPGARAKAAAYFKLLAGQ
ncbi:MAG TPA: hypothetical protein VF762_16855 [Blastocatellia bacterium]